MTDALPLYKVRGYRRSLRSYMGYRQEDHWATIFDCHCCEMLRRLLEDEAVLNEFLSRYPIHERDRRHQEVRYVALHWLADFAV